MTTDTPTRPQAASSTATDVPVADNDAPPQAAKPSALSTAKAVLKRFKLHHVQVISAGIAFYATLALVPTLIAVVSVYTIVTDPTEIAEQIDAVAGDTDPATADLIKSQLESAVAEAKGSGPTALALGIILALWSASGAVQKLMLSINLAYGATESRKGWKVRGLAYLFTAGAILGAVAATLLLGALPEIMRTVNLSGPTQVAVNILRFPLMAALMVLGLTLFYRFAPDRSPRTPWKNVGSIVGTSAFFVFSGLFALYFRFAGSMPASYGILGGIAAVIIYFQLCAVAITLGAETNGEVEEATTLDVAAGGTAEPTGNPLGFTTAVAGLAALFLLGRGE